MSNKFVVGVLVLALLGVGLSLYGLIQSDSSLGGSTRDDWSVGGNLAVTGTTSLTGETTLGNCGTASYTIPALGPRNGTGAGYATTSVTVTGAALGDHALISHSTTTQALAVYGVVSVAQVTAADTATVSFFNPTLTTSTAITTSTLKVCYFD